MHGAIRSLLVCRCSFKCGKAASLSEDSYVHGAIRSLLVWRCGSKFMFGSSWVSFVILSGECSGLGMNE